VNPPPEQVSLDPLLPAEMALRAETVGAAKANLPLVNLAALAVLAGAFIALGAAFFTTATTSTDLVTGRRDSWAAWPSAWG
jgi:formate/nitrite transporter FocA (FNT family)